MGSVNLSAALRLTQNHNDGAAILVLKKALDTFRQDGDNMVRLLAAMPLNARPGLGEKVDIRV